MSGSECPLLQRTARRIIDTIFCLRTHVFGDLRAYVCIWNNCVSSEQAFTTQRDWIGHMTSQHWRKWSCPFGCTTAFDDCESLEVHLRRAHAEEFGADRVGHVSALSSRTNLSRAEGQCPMCQKVEVKSIYDYRVHIGHHLEQLALFALQATSDSDGDDYESANVETEMHEGRREGRREHEPTTIRILADIEFAKIDYTKLHTKDAFSGSAPKAQASSHNDTSTSPPKYELHDPNRPSGQHTMDECKTGEEKKTRLFQSIEGKGKESSTYGGAESQPSWKDEKGLPSSADPPKSLDRLSMDTKHDTDPELGGGRPWRRSKIVREKKWFCASCQFGPLDWNNDKGCSKCGRVRDHHCRVKYQTRKVIVT